VVATVDEGAGTGAKGAAVKGTLDAGDALAAPSVGWAGDEDAVDAVDAGEAGGGDGVVLG